jgi:hypothetical protein
MANNLNQLTRRANKDGFEDVGWVLLDLYKELVKLLDDR